ncbi:MAG: 4'-phosphopantetheinyl transferase superfamily protein [bacterium]
MSDIFKRNQYIFSRSLLRLILSKFFKRPPLSFNILLSKDGKPFLDSRLLFFNISHSDSYLGILFSNASEVGLDLQKFRPITNLSSLIRRFFHPLEIDFLLSSPDMEGEFFRLWTLKEAYVKCLGHGISYGFHNFHCLNDQVTDPKMDTVFYLSYFCLSNLHIGFSTSVSHLFLYQDSPPLL